MFLTVLTNLDSYFLVDLKKHFQTSAYTYKFTDTLSIMFHEHYTFGIGPRIQLTHLIACNLPVIENFSRQ